MYLLHVSIACIYILYIFIIYIYSIYLLHQSTTHLADIVTSGEWIACLMLHIYIKFGVRSSVRVSVCPVWKQKLITPQPVDLEKISRCQNDRLCLLLQISAKVVPTLVLKKYLTLAGGYRPLRGGRRPPWGAQRAPCPPQLLQRRARSTLNF